MQKLFNGMADFGQTIVTATPGLLGVMAYAVTKDPHFAAFTFMATAMHSAEASANVTLLQEGFCNGAPAKYKKPDPIVI